MAWLSVNPNTGDVLHAHSDDDFDLNMSDEMLSAFVHFHINLDEDDADLHECVEMDPDIHPPNKTRGYLNLDELLTSDELDLFRDRTLRKDPLSIEVTLDDINLRW